MNKTHTPKWYAAMKKRMSGSKNPMFKNAKLASACLTCGKEFSYYAGSSSGKYCSQTCSNSGVEHCLAISKSKTGHKMSKETRAKMSVAKKGKRKPDGFGEKVKAGLKKYWDARGRISGFSHWIKSSSDFKKWVRGVLERAHFTCEECGQKGGVLDAHHILPISVLIAECKMGLITPENIHNPKNGICLCRACHKKKHSKGTFFHQLPEGRLIIALRNYHKNSGSIESFPSFYEKQMSKLCEHFKGKLK